MIRAFMMEMFLIGNLCVPENTFGFEVTVSRKAKSSQSTIESAFLKADTLKQLLVINTTESLT